MSVNGVDATQVQQPQQQVNFGAGPSKQTSGLTYPALGALAGGGVGYALFKSPMTEDTFEKFLSKDKEIKYTKDLTDEQKNLITSASDEVKANAKAAPEAAKAAETAAADATKAAEKAAPEAAKAAETVAADATKAAEKAAPEAAKAAETAVSKAYKAVSEILPKVRTVKKGLFGAAVGLAAGIIVKFIAD